MFPPIALDSLEMRSSVSSISRRSLIYCPDSTTMREYGKPVLSFFSESRVNPRSLCSRSGVIFYLANTFIFLIIRSDIDV